MKGAFLLAAGLALARPTGAALGQARPEPVEFQITSITRNEPPQFACERIKPIR